MTRIEELKTLPLNVQADIALCALVLTLTGAIIKHTDIMTKSGKDVEKFIDAYGEMIQGIAEVDADVLEALRVLIKT